MLRKLQRAVGSTDFVRVDFNPPIRCKLSVLSSVGTAHIVNNQTLLINMYRSDGTLFYARLSLRGLKSTVTISPEPMAL